MRAQSISRAQVQAPPRSPRAARLAASSNAGGHHGLSRAPLVGAYQTDCQANPVQRSAAALSLGEDAAPLSVRLCLLTPVVGAAVARTTDGSSRIDAQTSASGVTGGESAALNFPEAATSTASLGWPATANALAKASGESSDAGEMLDLCKSTSLSPPISRSTTAHQTRRNRVWGMRTRATTVRRGRSVLPQKVLPKVTDRQVAEGFQPVVLRLRAKDVARAADRGPDAVKWWRRGSSAPSLASAINMARDPDPRMEPIRRWLMQQMGIENPDADIINTMVQQAVARELDKRGG